MASQRFRAGCTIAPRYDHNEVLGLPKGAFAITNSERKTMACPRRWWWAYGLGLETATSPQMRFGSMFDEVMGEILEWYKRTEERDGSPAEYKVHYLDTCAYCDGNGCDRCSADPNHPHFGVGPLYRLRRTLAHSLEERGEVEDAWDMMERLYRALEGWLTMYDEQFRDSYKVVAVQPMIAVPVTSPSTGQVYKTKIPVVATDDGWRVVQANDSPESGEVHMATMPACQPGWRVSGEVQMVTMPVYQLCKLDGVVLNRTDGKLWVWETKTSGTPEAFSRDLLLDTQLPGYTRALWYASKALGAFGGEGRDVGGYVWDVTSNKMQDDPKVLKSGKVSVAKNQRIPSWRWLRYIREHFNYDDPILLDDAMAMAMRDKSEADLHSESAEHRREIAEELKQMEANADLLDAMRRAAENTDPKLYVRKWGEFTREQLRAYEVELYADASRIAGWLRNLAGTGEGRWYDHDEIAIHWPRVPLCRQAGGFCSFTGPCLEDSQQARQNYNTRQRIRWLNTAAAKDAGNNGGAL